MTDDPPDSTVIKNMGSTLAACGDVNRNVMAAAAPWKNRPAYVEAQKLANDIADLLAPQSGAYYDVWLDGEKFVSVYKEVIGDPCSMPDRCDPESRAWLVSLSRSACFYWPADSPSHYPLASTGPKGLRGQSFQWLWDKL